VASRRRLRGRLGFVSPSSPYGAEWPRSSKAAVETLLRRERDARSVGSLSSCRRGESRSVSDNSHATFEGGYTVKRFRSVLLLFVVIALSALPTYPLEATAGVSDRGSCNARITLSLWTGNPHLDCGPAENFDVKIEVVVCCPGACSTTYTFHRCSDTNTSQQFSACGKTHTVSLNSGTWGDALSDGEPIVYSAQ